MELLLGRPSMRSMEQVLGHESRLKSALQLRLCPMEQKTG